MLNHEVSQSTQQSGDSRRSVQNCCACACKVLRNGYGNKSNKTQRTCKRGCASKAHKDHIPTRKLFTLNILTYYEIQMYLCVCTLKLKCNITSTKMKKNRKQKKNYPLRAAVAQLRLLSAADL